MIFHIAMFDLSHIKLLSREVGFDLCGVAQCRVLEQDRRFFEGWLECGYASSLDYLKRNVECRADASRLVEGAKSVIVCAIAYKNRTSDGYSDSHRAKVASYACTTDYHHTIKQMLFALCKELKAECPSLSARCFVDSAPIFEKRYAVEAGLGWIGRNSLLVTPEYGSFVLLGEIVIDEEFDRYDAPYEGVGCGECHRCVEACPNGAVRERHIDTARCISCATIERRGEGGQCDLHGWVFGCDECQSVCPYNRRAPYYSNQRFAPLFSPENMTPQEWLALCDEEFDRRFASTPMVRSGLARIKENLEK